MAFGRGHPALFPLTAEYVSSASFVRSTTFFIMFLSILTGLTGPEK